jgi:hypothetical protein
MQKVEGSSPFSRFQGDVVAMARAGLAVPQLAAADPPHERVAQADLAPQADRRVRGVPDVAHLLAGQPGSGLLQLGGRAQQILALDRLDERAGSGSLALRRFGTAVREP